MAYIRPYRPPFDASCEFVATPPAGRRTLAVAGAQFPHGARIDKSLVDERRLRQMYESRKIALDPSGPALPERPPRPSAAVGRDAPAAEAAPAEEAAPPRRVRRLLERAEA